MCVCLCVCVCVCVCVYIYTRHHMWQVMPSTCCTSIYLVRHLFSSRFSTTNSGWWISKSELFHVSVQSTKSNPGEMWNNWLLHHENKCCGQGARNKQNKQTSSSKLVYDSWSMTDSNIVGTASVSSVMSDQYLNKTKATPLCFISFGPEFLWHTPLPCHFFFQHRGLNCGSEIINPLQPYHETQA